ncbi:phosphatase PAP2 family protein [Cellulomonas endophytica]|uniref:phosphatase PAP2 family protein n=1 Tax=Cellulomonas endophytica TaxID=2494735 RepID=UPI001F0C472C|nr:phosphatase PAP2 family protein [Cellulomonas endophytica]
MRGFAHRWDRLVPTNGRARHAHLEPGRVVRDLAVRAVAPAVALWAAVTGLGLLVVGPGDGLPAEEGVSEGLAADRTPFLDSVSHVVSGAASTGVVALVTALVVVAVAVRTRRWWFAAVPALAVLLELGVFLTSAVLVDRERPEVPQLDEAPPTSGYPSGHTGASAAVAVVLALLAQRVRPRGLRVAATVVCLLVPFLVGAARVYRGMHFPTDVAAGLLNGSGCALLAWGWLRTGTGAADRAATAGDGQTRA